MIAETDSYKHLFSGKNTEFVNFVREEGTYTFTSVNSHKDKSSNYGFYNPLDSSGKNIAYMTNGIYAVGGGKMMIDDEQQVYCIQPEINTYVNCKYEVRPVDENLDAAAAVIWGDDTSALKHIVIQGLVWNYTGSNFGNVVPMVYDNDIGMWNNLSEEDAAIVDEVKNGILNAKELYIEGPFADFSSMTEGVDIDNGVITLTRSDTPAEVVLKANNTDVLKYYSKGTIQYPEGVSGEVDLDNSTLTLTFNTNAINTGDEIKFSMVPEDFIGNTDEYYSNYNKQTLVAFRLANPKWESLSLKVLNPTTATIEGRKELTGREIKDGEFSFVLKDNDGNEIETVTNTGDTFSFSEIKYDKEGTYNYTISEVEGDDTTITYDKATFSAVVNVTIDANNNYIATTTYPDGDAVFHNKYEEEHPTETTSEEPESESETPGVELNKKSSPTTGDNSNIIIWVTISSVALLAISGAIYKYKKR